MKRIYWFLFRYHPAGMVGLYYTRGDPEMWAINHATHPDKGLCEQQICI